MKNKAPLQLMEQLIMILVFALTAALCLQGFATAHRISHRQQARDRAVVAAQNAAELLKSQQGDFAAAADLLGGNWDGTSWTVTYDGDFVPLSAGAASVYTMTAVPVPSGQPLLGCARIRVESRTEELFSLTAAWQEAAP